MNNNLFNFFNLSFLLGGYGTLEDIVCCSNKRVAELKDSLMIEVIELYEDLGYSKEEILDMINNIKFNDEDNFTKEEKEYFKKSAIEVLNIRVSLKEKNKNKIKEKEIDIYE